MIWKIFSKGTCTVQNTETTKKKKWTKWQTVFFLSFLTGRMKWKYREILGIISPIFLPGDFYFFIELNTSFDDTTHISAQKIKYKREKKMNGEFFAWNCFFFFEKKKTKIKIQFFVFVFSCVYFISQSRSKCSGGRGMFFRFFFCFP